MRTRKPGRLREIAAAALAVFTRQGFRLTQVADIAREAGISAGAVYSYVEGKDALLELAIAEAMGEVPEEAQSYEAVGIAGVGTALASGLRKATPWPVMKAALKQKTVSAAQLEAVVTELFHLVAGRRHLIWLLDRCARDIPELNGLYEGAVRRRLIDDFIAVIAAADKDRTLTGEQSEAKGRALFEMIAWVGMHRQRDRLPPPISNEAALESVVAITLRAVGAKT